MVLKVNFNFSHHNSKSSKEEEKRRIPISHWSSLNQPFRATWSSSLLSFSNEPKTYVVRHNIYPLSKKLENGAVTMVSVSGLGNAHAAPAGKSRGLIMNYDSVVHMWDVKCVKGYIS
jgi:hypothetical protein